MTFSSLFIGVEFIKRLFNRDTGLLHAELWNRSTKVHTVKSLYCAVRGPRVGGHKGVYSRPNGFFGFAVVAMVFPVSALATDNQPLVAESDTLPDAT